MNQSEMVSHELNGVDPDGRSIKVVLQVGVPYQVDEHTWVCELGMSGLRKHHPNIVGGSAFQSLCLAFRILRITIEAFIERGGALYETEGERFDPSVYF
jgi:hypothetical protein